MDLGVTLPTSGPHAGPDAIVRVAREAEALGYASVWTYERLLCPLGDVPQPGGPPRPLPEHNRTTYEPLETLAYVAAQTRTVRLGTSVLTALFHVPVTLARRLATLDRFSGGRAVAGLGQGWIRQEFTAAGVPPRRRGRGFEEFVAALRAAWAPDPVSFEGDFYRIPPSAVNPKPCRPGGVPVLVGGFAPAAVERAGRIGDGFNPMLVSPEALASSIGRFRAAAAAAGRDPGSLTVAVRANTPMTAETWDERRPFLGGSPEQIAEDLPRAAGMGVDEVLFTNPLQPPIDEQLRLLERLSVRAARVAQPAARAATTP
ncbi:TIGR03619 family F420-dependent LLM class oxidoreductase [Nucisporomicrobium flavum]|jgi:probable F420-dependent oxidoreductase|uniref:TIGR03619 family F420-dependent LLM class oxidoreductase n=1 Tax=Nucisporomicrobium flavum TaxID=2785915 RepID=UPI0018F6895D|nr:TIGR03619 family F420-dependent LLM class oxidoreductase [Nucisporomicrobium flavum]